MERSLLRRLEGPALSAASGASPKASPADAVCHCPLFPRSSRSSGLVGLSPEAGSVEPPAVLAVPRGGGARRMVVRLPLAGSVGGVRSGRCCCLSGLAGDAPWLRGHGPADLWWSVEGVGLSRSRARRAHRCSPESPRISRRFSDGPWPVRVGVPGAGCSGG